MSVARTLEKDSMHLSSKFTKRKEGVLRAVLACDFKAGTKKGESYQTDPHLENLHLFEMIFEMFTLDLGWR